MSGVKTSLGLFKQGGPLLVLLVAVLLPWVLDDYAGYQYAVALSYLPALLGLVVITGLTGQIALGNGAFFGLGAYATAILIKQADWPLLATLPVSVVLCLLVGALTGIPTLRLRGHFLAVLTLSIAVVFPQLLKHFEWLTEGVKGINLVLADPPAWLGITAGQAHQWLAVAVAAFSFIATQALVRSHLGRALRALRDNEQVAASFGVDVARLKILAFAYSAALAGLGGSVFAAVVGFISPDDFSIGFAALLIIGLVLGGKDSVWGAVIGCVLIVLIPLYAARIDQAASGFTFAVLVIVCVFIAPFGLAGLVRRFVLRLRARAAVRQAGAGAPLMYSKEKS